jgi:hypothetical protein
VRENTTLWCLNACSRIRSAWLWYSHADLAVDAGLIPTIACEEISRPAWEGEYPGAMLGLASENNTRELQGREAFLPSKRKSRGLFSAYLKIVKIGF